MKKAIALIELIFAIVVIAITLLSVPNLITVTNKSTNNAFTQEAISNAASHLSMVMSQYWDELNSKNEYSNSILTVDNGSIELNEASDVNGFLLGRRVGSNIETPRRFAVDINGTRVKASTTLGGDINDTTPDDVDDYNGQSYTLVTHVGEDMSAKLGDFKDVNVTISTTVNYVSDNANYDNNIIVFNNPDNNILAQSSNIKLITVNLTSPNNPKKRVVLKAFSCNIGGVKFKERKF